MLVGQWSNQEVSIQCLRLIKDKGTKKSRRYWINLKNYKGFRSTMNRSWWKIWNSSKRKISIWAIKVEIIWWKRRFYLCPRPLQDKDVLVSTTRIKSVNSRPNSLENDDFFLIWWVLIWITSTISILSIFSWPDI